MIIEWKITDSISLEAGRGSAASRGPGLQLRWAYSPSWAFALGVRYEKIRFRFDDDGAAPGGVGEDTAVPLFALAEFAFSADAKLSILGGTEVGRQSATRGCVRTTCQRKRPVQRAVFRCIVSDENLTRRFEPQGDCVGIRNDARWELIVNIFCAEPQITRMEEYGILSCP